MTVEAEPRHDFAEIAGTHVTLELPGDNKIHSVSGGADATSHYGGCFGQPIEDTGVSVELPTIRSGTKATSHVVQTLSQALPGSRPFERREVWVLTIGQRQHRPG